MQVINTLVICFFIALASSYIILSILKYNEIKNSILFFITLFISNIISTLFLPAELRFIYGFLIHSLLTLIILKQNIIKSISIGFIIMFIVTIAEILISIIFIFCFDITIDIIKTNEIVILLLNISIAILMSLIVSIKKIKATINKLLIWFESSKYKYFIIVVMLSFLYLLVAKNSVLTSSRHDFLLNLLFITFISILFVLVLNAKNDIYNLNKANKQMLKYLNKYESIITDQGKKTHEFKNQLLVIRGYLDTNIKKLEDYLIEITKDINASKSNYLISQLNNLPNGGLKGLIYYKISEIEENNIKYELYVDKKVKNFFKNAKEKLYINLTKILGVCIDNAIEATNKTLNKEILLQAYIKENKAIFVISNTFHNKKIYQKIKSNKKINTKKRGFGLLILQEIISSQDNINVIQEIDKNTFVTKVEIHKPFN